MLFIKQELANEKKIIIHLHSSPAGILSDRELQKIEEKEKVGAVVFRRVTGMTHARGLPTLRFPQWDNGSEDANDGILMNLNEFLLASFYEKCISSGKQGIFMIPQI